MNTQIKYIVAILYCCFIAQSTFSQHKTSFVIEDLKRAEKTLSMSPKEDVFVELLARDKDFPSAKYAEVKGEVLNLDFVAGSELPDSLVTRFGLHPFFNGMYQAYADHRPFVLSPDMMWLLVSQGFARHVNANAEKLRSKFVNYQGKLDLIVDSKDIRLDDPNSNWESVFDGFSSQISEKVGNELVNALTADFSTTTSIEKVASQITIMEAVKPYFEFIVMCVVCGIPEITLEGTPEDWQKIIYKLQPLRKHDLNWWIDEIEPLLQEFVEASKGNVDTEFWRNMFKYHSQKKYGAPNIIDGWIVKFFPYNKKGERNNLDSIIKTDELPAEMVKVDIKHIVTDGTEQVVTPLELWAGFVGLEQNNTTMALRPKIGWMIRKKSDTSDELYKKFEEQSQEYGLGGIQIRVDKVPKELLRLKQIKSLEIEFIDKIDIPNEMANIEIEQLKLTGEISKNERDRIIKMFPETALTINQKEFNYRFTFKGEVNDEGTVTFRTVKEKIKK